MYEQKYLKYKKKYLNLKNKLVNQYGGNDFNIGDTVKVNGLGDIEYLIIKKYVELQGNSIIIKYDVQTKSISRAIRIERNITSDQLELIERVSDEAVQEEPREFNLHDTVIYKDHISNHLEFLIFKKYILNGKTKYDIQTKSIRMAVRTDRGVDGNLLILLKTRQQELEELELANQQERNRAQQERNRVEQERLQFNIDEYEDVKYVTKSNLKKNAIIKMHSKIYRITGREDPPQWRSNEPSRIKLESLSNGSKKTLNADVIIRSESKIVQKI